MGTALAAVRLQVRRQALTHNESIARVVPDVSGIDKQFDYSIPPPFLDRVRPGAVVRVELHGRRVDAWVTETGTAGSPGFDEVPVDRLLPLLSVADLGVDQSVVELCAWIARQWSGPVRNVLATATPQRKKSRGAHARNGRFSVPDGDVSSAVDANWARGGAVLRVPPLASALDAVVACAARGPVLVVCPTVRMVRLGAAALRRRGLVTAELPDQVEAAAAGVDVVIGARSGVLAPCHGLASIVVIDEHEESLHEERVPTWSASAVAAERGRRAGAPVFLVSPVPSASAEILLGPSVRVGDEDTGWPRIDVVDLNEVPVRGSLLSSELIETVAGADGAVLCILNTKGGARLLACRSCRAMQTCDECRSTVGESEGHFVCGACGAGRAAVCGSCGRTSFATLRAGTGRLADELRVASRLPVVEVTSSTDGTGNTAAVYVGTDALLHRVSTARCVVFADIDRDLSAPRMSSGREVAAAVARAARSVGRQGRVIIQTRQPGHPLLRAMAGRDIDGWRAVDTSMAHSLGLPPFVHVARCTSTDGWQASAVPASAWVEWSADGNVLVARSQDRTELLAFVEVLRQAASGRFRVEIDPPRL